MNNPSNLKILGGIARGKRLDSPEVYLRPMMGKVREAVFSTFYSFGLYDEDIFTTHLDIFSGSGSVGLESLSRGAKHCTFVDLSRDCCDTIERNIKWCDFDDEEEGYSTRVICADAVQALTNPVSVGIPNGTAFHIVTLCPPYEEIVYFDLIEAVANSPAVGEDTVILIEYPVELGCLPHVITRKDGGKLVGVRNRKYGRTVIAMYVVNPSGRLGNAAESRPQEFVSI
jgi:16S rRNA (guanine966-N2)-methyltransferase